MTTQDLQNCITNLAQRRKAFWSEADFQFELAWEIKQAIPAANVRLERPFPTSTKTTEHIDIVVELYGELYPIELKYKTKGAQIQDINNETILLKNHSATDFGCYDYLKDVSRLEGLKKTTTIKRGFAIILTNDPAYYNNTQRFSAYDNFKIYDGVTRSGRLSWGLTYKCTPFAYGSRIPFSLNGTYTMKWNVYNTYFLYLITEV